MCSALGRGAMLCRLFARRELSQRGNLNNKVQHRIGITEIRFDRITEIRFTKVNKVQWTTRFTTLTPASILQGLVENKVNKMMSTT